MNVQEFIHDALTQIANAVQAANNTFSTQSSPAEANPAGAESESRGGLTYVSVSNTQMISFDIAVTVDETSQTSTEKKGGLSLKVVSGGIGGSKSTETSSSSVSRLQFKIPLKLPRPKTGK